jgi:hypothetical protein
MGAAQSTSPKAPDATGVAAAAAAPAANTNAPTAAHASAPAAAPNTDAPSANPVTTSGAPLGSALFSQAQPVIDYFAAAPSANSAAGAAAASPPLYSAGFDLGAPVWRVPFAEPLVLALGSTVVARQVSTTSFKLFQHGFNQLDMRQISNKLSWGQHAAQMGRAFIPVMPARGSVLSPAVYLATYETVRTDWFAPIGRRWASNWSAPLAGGTAGAAGYMLVSVLPSIVRQGAEVRQLREAAAVAVPTAAPKAVPSKLGKKAGPSAALASAAPKPKPISLSIPVTIHAFGMLSSALHRGVLFGTYSALTDDRSAGRRAAASRSKEEEAAWVAAGGKKRGNRILAFMSRLSSGFLAASLGSFVALPFERVRSLSIASLAVSRRYDGAPTRSPLSHWHNLSSSGMSELFKGGSTLPARAIPTALTLMAFDYAREAYLASKFSNAYLDSPIPRVDVGFNLPWPTQ